MHYGMVMNFHTLWKYVTIHSNVKIVYILFVWSFFTITKYMFWLLCKKPKAIKFDYSIFKKYDHTRWKYWMWSATFFFLEVYRSSKLDCNQFFTTLATNLLWLMAPCIVSLRSPWTNSCQSLNRKKVFTKWSNIVFGILNVKSATYTLYFCLWPSMEKLFPSAINR